MILACLDNMVKSHASRIRSGWKNIFSVFTLVASERREALVESAFRTTSDVISEPTRAYILYCVRFSERPARALH